MVGEMGMGAVRMTVQSWSVDESSVTTTSKPSIAGHLQPCMAKPPTLAVLQVDSLEQALAAQDPAPLLAELEACQGRLRQSQAACGSKDSALRELRERLEQQTRWAGQCGGEAGASGPKWWFALRVCQPYVRPALLTAASCCLPDLQAGTRAGRAGGAWAAAGSHEPPRPTAGGA